MIPLYKPFMPEIPLANEILQSGQLAYGKFGKEFESLLANYLECSNVLVTNTFNMAILVALTTLDVKAGDTAIVSPMACLASTQPLLSMGIKVQWADVDPATGTLSPESVRSLMHLDPKVIIHNHYCGHLGHVDEINCIGKEFNVPIIDDGIEAFGSEYKGKKLGNVGSDVTFFSFNPVRIPNTLDGGAIVFKSDALFQKSKLIRDAGIDRTRFRDSLGEISPNCDIQLVGHSATPMELNGYIGVQQMNNVDRLLQKQRDNAKIWNQLLAANTNLKPLINDFGNPNYWVYGLLAKDKKASIQYFREKGFYASGVHINNNIYSVFNNKISLKGVNEFMNHFVAIPSGWWLENPSLQKQV